MTDKEKIRKEVERLRNLHQMKYQQLDADSSMSLVECGKRNLCNELLSFIDTLQEEPVSCLDNGDMPKERWKQAVEAASHQRNYRSSKGLTETKDDYFVDGVQWADEHPKEEPVSEDLGEYINELSKQFPELSFAKLSRIAVRAAKWQKAQFEKNRLKHCNSITNEQAELEQGFIDQHIDKYNRMPTFLDAIEYGMQLQKEKMMAKAIDVEVKVDAGGYPYIDKTIELYDYDKDVPLAKEGDKYKVVLIKEN